MAQDWTIVTQYPDIETDGGSVARPVMVVGTVTAEHGVYFERRYPRATFKESIAQIDANGFTIVFEDLFKIPHVDSVTWGQKLNAAGNLIDFVTVYYVSTSGNSNDYLEVLFSQLTQQKVANSVKAGVAVLDANENA